MKIDTNGLAWVWHIAGRKWIKRWPVDARECIAMGECSEYPPKDEQEKLPPGFTSEGPPPRHVLEEEFGRFPVSTLRTLCQENKVSWVREDTQKALVAKLITAGVMPPEGRDVPLPTGKDVVGLAHTRAKDIAKTREGKPVAASEAD